MSGFYRLGREEMQGFVFMKDFNARGALKEPLGLIVSRVLCPKSCVCDKIHGSCITKRVPTCRAM